MYLFFFANSLMDEFLRPRITLIFSLADKGILSLHTELICVGYMKKAFI